MIMYFSELAIHQLSCHKDTMQLVHSKIQPIICNSVSEQSGPMRVLQSGWILHDVRLELQSPQPDKINVKSN